MEFGIWTPLPHTIRAEPEMQRAVAQMTARGPAGPDRNLEFAASLLQYAEAHGFTTTLVAQRYLGPDPDAWILATALMTLTRRMEIMVAVHPGIIPPQVVAKMAATLDRVGNGRMALNVVNGWWQQEMDLFGNGAWLADPEARSRRMGEFIDVIQALWTGEAPRLHGEFYALEGAHPIPTVQIPHPPIYAASRTPLGKDHIARTCNAWFADYKPDRHAFAANLAMVEADIADMTQRAATHGRILRYGLSVHVICEDTMEQAEAEALSLEQYGQQDRIAAIAAKAMGAGLVGTPELLAGRIAAYEAAGVDLLLIRWHPMRAGLETFVQRVMPLLAKTPTRQVLASA